MSRTEAAELARVKTKFPRWEIRRTPDGFAARHRGSGEWVTEKTVASLEHALTSQAETREQGG